MFSRLGKNISPLYRACPLCGYGQANELGLCRCCFNDLPRCPPVNVLQHVQRPVVGIRLLLAPLWYLAEVRYWLNLFKFQGHINAAQTMAVLMVAQVLEVYRREQIFLPQYLVPVPMTLSAWTRRGYNQAQVLAEAVSDLLGIPLLYAVRRLRQKKKAHQLNAQQRAEALQASFEQVAELPRGTRLALIDDVFTTGATLGAVAAALPQAGVIVDAWVLAYTPPPKQRS